MNGLTLITSKRRRSKAAVWCVLALTLVPGVTNAFDWKTLGFGGDDEPIKFNIPAITLPSAAELFVKQARHEAFIGAEVWDTCSEVIVGPVIGTYTRDQAWQKITEPICADSRLVLAYQWSESAKGKATPVYMLERLWAGLQSVREFRSSSKCSCWPMVGHPFILFCAVDARAPGKLQFGVAPSVVGKDRLNLGTTVVTGNRELPKVLNIVPWKKSAPADLPAQPFNSVMDEALTPLDRDVFRRELRYYESTHSR